MSSTASPVLSIMISYKTLSSNFQKFGPELGNCSGMKFEISATRSGRWGLTNAYRSVLSASGSWLMSGASRWLEAVMGAMTIAAAMTMAATQASFFT